MKEGCLACPVGSDQPDSFPAVNVEGNVTKKLIITQKLAHPLK
jgi:hypothetical protein